MGRFHATLTLYSRYRSLNRSYRCQDTLTVLSAIVLTGVLLEFSTWWVALKCRYTLKGTRSYSKRNGLFAAFLQLLCCLLQRYRIYGVFTFKLYTHPWHGLDCVRMSQNDRTKVDGANGLTSSLQGMHLWEGIRNYPCCILRLGRWLGWFMEYLDAVLYVQKMDLSIIRYDIIRQGEHDDTCNVHCYTFLDLLSKWVPILASLEWKHYVRHGSLGENTKFCYTIFTLSMFCQRKITRINVYEWSNTYVKYICEIHMFMYVFLMMGMNEKLIVSGVSVRRTAAMECATKTPFQQ